MRPQATPCEAPPPRILGVDLLRIMAMFMVVTLHVLGPGGVFASVPPNSVSFHLVRVFWAENHCAVDLFMMMSGWLLVKKRFRPSRLFELGCQVYFISLAIRFVAVLRGDVVVWTSFPQDFWYWNVYLAIMLFSPFMNAGLQNFRLKWNNKVVWFLLVVLSAMISFLPFKAEGVNRGYGIGWMLVCYLFGGWARLSVGRIRSLRKLLGIELVALFLPVLSVAIRFILAKTGLPEPSAFRGYQSPLNLGCALCHLVFFSNLPIQRIPSWVRWASDASFGVYLFHMQPILRAWILNARFSDLGLLPFPLLVLSTWAASIYVYFLCASLDSIRAFLFRHMALRKGIEIICNWSSKRLELHPVKESVEQ